MLSVIILSAVLQNAVAPKSALKCQSNKTFFSASLMLRQNKIECLPLSNFYPSLRLASKEPEISGKISGAFLGWVLVLTHIYIGEGMCNNVGDNETQQRHHRPINRSVSDTLVLALATLGSAT